MQQFKHLFTPINIGTMKLKNRIVMLPVTTGYCELDETIGDRFINFLRRGQKEALGSLLFPSPRFTRDRP